MLSPERMQEILVEKAGCWVAPHVLAGVLAVAEEAVRKELEGYVAISDDMKSVFIDGFGELEIQYPKATLKVTESPAASDVERDAARYRHLKRDARAMSLDMGGNHTWHMQLRNIRGPSLDDAIDAAIAKQGAIL